MDVVNGQASINGREDLKRSALQANSQEEQGGDDVEDLITAGLFLKPGDVAVLDGLSSTLAVFVQNIGPHSQFVRADGQWVHTRLADVDFVIPGALSTDLLEPLLPYLPTKVEKLDGSSGADRIQIPRDFSAPISEFLDKLTADSERIYRENAAVLDSAYVTLADRTRTRIMTRNQIASLLLAPDKKNYVPSTAEVLALRKVIKYHPFGFYTDARIHRLTNVYHIRAKDEVEDIEQVHRWVRSYSEYRASTANLTPEERPVPTQAASNIIEFAKTARYLIELSRKRRDPLFGILGPDKHPNQRVPFPNIKFSETEMKIINLLQAWVLSSGNSDDLYSAATVILAATERYTDALRVAHGSAADEAGRHKLTREWGYVLLQEMGVLRPYENRALYDEKLMLPTVRPSRNVDLLKTKAELVRMNPNFRDSMKDLRNRHELEVYCIDNADAHEIDDGISISSVEGEPSQYWIHVHVANPTAFFDKTHVLSGLAAHMAESLYVPERTYSMLPSWVSENFFSIDQGRPVLTISARVDESGTVLENRIELNTVRRVTKITYDELTRILGETPEKSKHIVVGNASKISVQKERTFPQLSKSKLRDLRALYDVSRILYKRRKDAGRLKLQYARTGCNLFKPSGEPGVDWHPPSVEKPVYTSGDVIIDLTYSPKTAVTGGHQARHIVEEMMTLACSVAGDWCVERNIPAIFRGTVAVPGQIYTADELEAMMARYSDKGEEVPPRLLSHWRRSQNALVHASAIPHGLLKTSSYSRVTSPLRRFGDMITHWQMEAALLYEASTGRKFDAHDKNAQEVLPFSADQIRESILIITSREKAFSRTDSASRRHWAMVAFTRALHYKQGILPEQFKVTVQESDVVTKPDDTLLGEMHGFGLMVSVMPPANGQQMESFDEWEVQPVDINVYRRTMTVQAVRLLRRLNGEGLEAQYKDMTVGS